MDEDEDDDEDGHSDGETPLSTTVVVYVMMIIRLSTHQDRLATRRACIPLAVLEEFPSTAFCEPLRSGTCPASSIELGYDRP